MTVLAARQDKNKNQISSLYFFLLLLLAISIIMSLLIGRFPKPGIVNPVILFRDPMAAKIIYLIRIPRIISAILTGAVLASSGYVFQMIFGNPLVEPGFLGISQGAAFGAAGTILFAGYIPWLIQPISFIFALCGLMLSVLLASKFRYGGWILRLILAGIAISALFTALLSLLKFSADPLSELQDITFWLLGGLWNADWDSLAALAPGALLSIIILFFYRWRLHILSLDDRTVFSSGISPKFEKRMLLITATLGTASAISVTGLVGWIGLIVPHIARRITKTDPRHTLPVCMLIGALYMLVSDTIGRSIFSGEIPLGIITSITGALLFILILTAKDGGFGESI